MTSIAVTDHGCVQAFPDANHALDKGDPFKVIYGVEGYLVDDTKQLVENSKGQSFKDSYVVFDAKKPPASSPLKIRSLRSGAVKVVDGAITEALFHLCKPGCSHSFDIEKLTGINDAMVLPLSAH